ncbi:MAG TPA: cyclic beta 1-2 glucan synthetase, partial [Bacteroidia bacterium]|nr:cyclic beta 1-2 glucan synthetase [Bacteroidia bacterium]
MKLIPAAHELISNMRAFFQTSNSKRSYMNEEPLRAELYSSEQLGRFGKTLAGTHKLSSKTAKDHLLRRLSDNENVLHEVRKLLTYSIKRKYQITPAGEWLIDNFYLIEEHILSAKRHFPKDYSEDLPQLAEGASAGLTRIYDIVLQIIAHSDGRIDIESLSGFIKAYQTVTNLKLGELWAIPIMLRLALIENLRRVSAQIAIDRVDINLADYWARQLVETAEKEPRNLILVIADMARSNPPIDSAFVSEITRQLRGRGPDLALALNWIEQQLSESGLTSTELINAEIQKQSAHQVSVSNSIGSLRMVGATDWRGFVEEHSIVDQTLREDNGGIYGQMDFSTRDRYRHVVENIAKKSKISEHEVARIAIQLMAENIQSGIKDERTAHVGYYLIDEGLEQTEKLAKMQMSGIVKIRRVLKRKAFPLYLGFIVLITLAITSCVLFKAYSDTKYNWLLAIIGVLSIICASQLAVSVVNFFSSLLVKPHLLPRMDFSKEIPGEFKTLVVLPVMLTNVEDIEDLVESLEVRFLANRKDNLHFGLLTDFMDAQTETLPDDQVLLAAARQKIESLNVKYKREKKDLFYLFHRPRLWNPKENAWMGYERKRGKLFDLNLLLRGGSDKKFSLIVGDQSIFPQIKYVITLDSDTQLPLGTAWKLVGTMAHPLNHPWYDVTKKRVTKGYGILQPRVTVSLPNATASRFARMHGNEPGVDPYTRASSDVYQDLFAEGSFIGKGIYEVDTFIKVLDDRFPKNRILSHDLVEGCYVRSGLLSDVQLFEKYPNSYRADRQRIARWTRGDWQIFPWFTPVVPGGEKHWLKNPVSALSRWKIFDNIRRSLVPLALTILILLGWLVLSSYIYWTIAVSAIIVIPIIITTLWDTIRKPKDIILKHHIKNTITNIVEIFIKTSFSLICLPYEAFSNFKAILLTIWRMLATKKKLLEWNPSSNDYVFNDRSLAASYFTMWIEPLLAFTVFGYIASYTALRLDIAGPILLLWIIAPFVTWWSSRPTAKAVSKLSHEQNIFLGKVARKTFSFFEQFVQPEDNWLPPDNFQEQPLELLAHRTSPTNIGLSLLANLSAFEFGYITTRELIERTTNTISTMHKMERFKGHFYNWYDTQTLDPLTPKYVSTVDSGNLIGNLLVLKQGLLAVPDKKLLGHYIFYGLRDTLNALTDTLDEKNSKLLLQFKSDLEDACNSHVVTR